MGAWSAGALNLKLNQLVNAARNGNTQKCLAQGLNLSEFDATELGSQARRAKIRDDMYKDAQELARGTF